jgi:hypothetical protein
VAFGSAVDCWDGGSIKSGSFCTSTTSDEFE